MAVNFKTKPVLKKATVPKVRPKTKVKDEDEGLFFNELVDKLGELEEEVDEAKKVLENYELVKKQLRTECDNLVGADIGIMVSGEHYIADFGKRGNKSSILVKNETIVPLLGQVVFNAAAKIGVGDLKKYLTEEELVGILKVEKTGPRSLKIMPKV